MTLINQAECNVESESRRGWYVFISNPCVKIPTTTMLPPRVPVRLGYSTAFVVSTVVACKADAFSQAMSATESLIAPMDQTKSIADTKGVHHNFAT